MESTTKKCLIKVKIVENVKDNKFLTDKINYRERNKKEADGTQRLTRDRTQRAEIYEVRNKELKNEVYEHRKKGMWHHEKTTEAERKFDKILADVCGRIVREW